MPSLKPLPQISFQNKWCPLVDLQHWKIRSPACFYPIDFSLYRSCGTILFYAELQISLFAFGIIIPNLFVPDFVPTCKTLSATGTFVPLKSIVKPSFEIILQLQKKLFFFAINIIFTKANAIKPFSDFDYHFCLLTQIIATIVSLKCFILQ